MKFLIALIVALIAIPAAALDYSVIAVRSERLSDEHFPRLAEVMDPIHHPPSDLVIIHPDGKEEVLVSGGGKDAILDPKTLDGRNVYFVRISDCQNRQPQRRHIGGGMPKSGADIYSINIESREEIRWTDQSQFVFEGFANSGIGFSYGVFNMGPQPLPDGRLIYTSSRRRLRATKSFTAPCMQLHVLHNDGRIECVGVMSQGSALHPELLRDGRIAFSSYESMGLRDRRRWSLWSIHPDGTNWGPLISSYGATAFHFHTQRSDGKIVSAEYYNLNNNGFGTLLEIDEFPTFADPGEPKEIRAGYHFDGKERGEKYRFASSGLRNLMPWNHARDEASTRKSWAPSINADSVKGDYLGKVTHPSAAPGNAVLMTFSGGPVCRQKRPTNLPAPHCEIRILKGDLATSPDDLEIVHRADGFNYTQPRALVSFKEIYGTEPIALPDKTDPTKSYGVFGSSDAFVGQWKFGLDSGGQEPANSIVFIGTEPNVAQTYGRDNRGELYTSGETGWRNGINERLRFLGEYDFSEPDRPEGDHSFRVKLPADVPFTVAIRGSDGRFLTCGQSWKQVRPGYQEINCGGCHNHAGEMIPGDNKYAWRDDYVLKDFTGGWRAPEYHKDVKPILEDRCFGCHDGEQANADLSASGISRYIKPMQAGQSLLSHHIRGERGLEQMPLGGEPLTDEQIRVIDEWIDFAGLIDEGEGRAFDVFAQFENPNPVDEPLPIGGGEPDDKDKVIAEQSAVIERLKTKIEKAREALE